MATVSEILRLAFEVTGAKDVANLRKEIDALAAEGDESAKALQKLVGELTDLKAAESAAKAITGVKASLADTRSNLASATAGLNALNEEFSAADRSSKAVAKAFRIAEKSVADLTAKERQQNIELQRLQGTLAKAGVDTGQLASETERLDREITETTKATAAQATAMRANRDAADTTVRRYNALGEAMGKARARTVEMQQRLLSITTTLGVAGAALAAFKVGDFLKDSVLSAAEFEQAIASIAAVTGATAQEMQRLESGSTQAALATGLGFDKVNQTLGDLARTVGDADKALATLKPTLDLATSGTLDAARAGEILTTTLTQFGLSTEDAAKVADTLVKVANSSSVSVEQLGSAMSYAAPLARQLGMDLDETSVAIGALAEEGFRGERAGTALRNVLGAMGNPASKFSKELSGLGITTRNFNEVIEALVLKGDRGKRALLALDAEARPAILALVNSGAKNIDRLSLALQGAEGEAARVAEAMRQKVGPQLDRAGVAFELLRNKLVEPLLEPLAREMEALSKALVDFVASPEFALLQTALKETFTEASTAVRNFIADVDFTAVVAQVTAFAGSIQTFAKEASSYFEQIKVGVQVLGVAFNALQTGIFGIVAALAKFGELSAKMLEMQLNVMALIPATKLAAKALGGDLAEATKKASEAAVGMRGVYEEFAARTIANAGETRTAIEGIASSIDGNTQASNEAATAATERANAEAAAAEKSSDANVKAAEKTKVAVSEVGQELRKAVAASAEAAQALQEAMAGNATKAAIGEAEANLRKANARVAEIEASLTKAGAAAGTIAQPVKDATTSIEKADKAAAGLAKSAETASAALRDTAHEAGGLADAAGQVADEGDRTAQSLVVVTGAAVDLSAALGDVSEAFRQAAEAQAGRERKIGGRESGIFSEYRSQREELDRQVMALKEQNAEYDEMEQRIRALRGRFNFVGDDTLRQLAEQEQRLEENQRRAAEERQRKQERDAAAAARTGEPDPPLGANVAAAAAAGTFAPTVNVIGQLSPQDTKRLMRQLYGDWQELQRLSR